MPIALGAYAKNLQERLTGVLVEFDGETDNLIIHDNELGFCVTRKYIDDHTFDHVADIAKQTVAVLHKQSCGPDGAKICTLAALKSRGSDTSFDTSKEH